MDSKKRTIIWLEAPHLVIETNSSWGEMTFHVQLGISPAFSDFSFR